MRHFFIYLLPALIAAALLIYYMKPLTHWLGNLIHPRVDFTQVVGNVQKVTGRVVVKKYRQKEYMPLKQGEAVYNYDRIQVVDKSNLILSFPSGYLLQFSENSEFILELWDYQKPQLPTYIYLNYGQHKMLKKGKAGTLYIIKNNKQFIPEQTIPPQVPLEVLPPGVEVSDTRSKTDSLPNIPKPPKTPPRLRQDPNKLSNEYIEKVVRQQRSLFEDCLANGLRDDGVASGDILVGFSILPSGKTADVKAISNQLTSKKLKNCVLNVFQRIRFRSFQGKPIDFSYPINFK